jgi:dTDP-4-amino-4,6-dideoxygalactose transaminase
LAENQIKVPFNDLSRIHLPLLEEFKNNFSRLVESSSLILGEEVSCFEDELAILEKVRFAVGVNSGTSAIQLALRALGIGEGDEVITTSFTFVATTFAILETGAIPVLVDIDPNTGLIDPGKLNGAISNRTRALVLVTLHGRVENLEIYQNFCVSHGLKFIIDAAQSHLGTFKGESQTTYCDIATLSFYPGKNLGALGEGGAILTNSESYRNTLLMMRDWGASKKYMHKIWGGNFRLDPIQATFLRTKMKYLEDWTRERQEIALTFQEGINPAYQMSRVQTDGSHVFHVFAIKVPNRTAFIQHLENSGVAYGIHYPIAVHQQEYYSELVKFIEPLLYSESIAEQTLSLPIFPGMSTSEIQSVINAVNSFNLNEN